MKPGFLALVVIAALAGLGGALFARHERLRTTREMGALAAVLDEAQALAAAPVTSESGPGLLDAGRITLDPKRPAFLSRRSSEEALSVAAAALRGERATGPVARLGLDRAFRGTSTFSRAWGEGVQDGVARARVLVGWKVDGEVELRLIEVKRGVE